LASTPSANANYSYFGLINEFAVNPTKDLNEAEGGALTMRSGDVRQGQRK
jgi:dTDP-4-amino-4,6-dideoxygalactose transaminase